MANPLNKTVIRNAVSVNDPRNPENALAIDSSGAIVGAAMANAASVTPSDATVFSPQTRSLFVGGAGNVAVRLFGSQTVVTLTAVPAGTTLPIAVDKVMLTNTTATAIIRMW